MKMQLKSDQTIVAPASGSGGAVAIIRVSGPDALAISDRVVRLRKGTVSASKGFSLHFGEALSGGEVVDEVLVSVFRAPRSYTGEDSVEISCHASPFIVHEIVHAFTSCGARMAEAGEFTSRAYLNGKMDLSQAEAVADLISSTSKAASKVSLNQLRGGVSSELGKMREELLKMASLLELELDFGEEEVEFASRESLVNLLDGVIAHVDSLSGTFRTGNAIRRGIPVTIAGNVNAGKSTLLNAILGDDRAIVSPTPGTTRDTVEDTLTIDGHMFRFIDTAGIRESSDDVEKIGIERSFKKISEAEIVLGVLDATDSENDLLNNLSILEKSVDLLQQKLIILLNKVDLIANKNVNTINNIVSYIGNKYITIKLSAKEKIGLDLLFIELSKVAKAYSVAGDSTIIINARHYDALLHARVPLVSARSAITSSLPSDLIAEDLRQAISILGEITGTITTPDILEEIFGKFCIGK